MARSSNWGIAVVCLCVLMANLMMPLAEGVWLSLPSSGTKCVSEEIQSNVVVLADYVVVKEHERPADPNITVSAKVTSPYGNTLYHKENVTYGQFAFTTSEIGNYLACFWVDGHEGTSLNLDWKIGVNAKDWESVAKKEHIEGVELELRKLEGAVESIHHNLLYLKHREEEMREDTYISTGSTSYADKRADFVKSKGKEPSHIEFFEMTHKKDEAGFVDQTLSSQFLDEAKSKVEEILSNSSSSKSRT